MDIRNALKLKSGDKVKFPEDMGNPPGEGIVTNVSTVKHENINNCEYVWVTIRVDHHESVWPSNRLERGNDIR